MNNNMVGVVTVSTNLLFNVFGKVFFLLLSVLILVFLMITVKQIHLMNRQNDFCLRQPLVSVAKFWIYITIILAIIVILFI